LALNESQVAVSHSRVHCRHRFPTALFASSGSVKFWQGRAWLAVFFMPFVVFMSYLYKHDPQLLERRNAAEGKSAH
jgi:hypothetical protein